jgi:peptidyl-prolyl cis-trans isomerase D
LPEARQGLSVRLHRTSAGAFFRVNAILAAEETTFDEARADLAIEIQTDAARRAISDQVEAVDDLLAGGATLEDLAKEVGMTLATIDYAPSAPGQHDRGLSCIPRGGRGGSGEDFAEGIVLEDGGLVALRLDEDRAGRTHSVRRGP